MHQTKVTRLFWSWEEEKSHRYSSTWNIHLSSVMTYLYCEPDLISCNHCWAGSTSAARLNIWRNDWTQESETLRRPWTSALCSRSSVFVCFLLWRGQKKLFLPGGVGRVQSGRLRSQMKAGGIKSSVRESWKQLPTHSDSVSSTTLLPLYTGLLQHTHLHLKRDPNIQTKSSRALLI